jgi:hypothetical protein
VGTVSNVSKKWGLLYISFFYGSLGIACRAGWQILQISISTLFTARVANFLGNSATQARKGHICTCYERNSFNPCVWQSDVFQQPAMTQHSVLGNLPSLNSQHLQTTNANTFIAYFQRNMLSVEITWHHLTCPLLPWLVNKSFNRRKDLESRTKATL